MYIDLEGQVCAINHKTGDRVVGHFVPKSGSQNSRLEGKTFDSAGKEKWEINGSWQKQISIKNLETDSSETIWKEHPLVPDAKMQYYYSKFSITLNWMSDEMKTYIAPTDSRMR